MEEIYLVFIQSKKDNFVFNSSVDCFKDYSKAKGYIDMLVDGQKRIEKDTCYITRKYDNEINILEAHPHVNGWLTGDNVLYYVQTKTTVFNETVYMDRFIVKSRFI